MTILLDYKKEELYNVLSSLDLPKYRIDQLVNAIYNGKISAASLSSCVIKNETGRLTIKERKK